MNKNLLYISIIAVLAIILAGSLWFCYLFYNSNVDGKDYLIDLGNVTCKQVSEEYNLCTTDKYFVNGTRVIISGLQPV